MPSSSPSSSSSSTASSSSRKRVTFMDTDTVISLPSHEPSEASEIRPQVTPPAMPPSLSPNSTTSTLSTSGPHTPPPNSNGGILIQGQDNVTTNSDSLTPTLSDAIVLLEAKALDTYIVPLHKCLTTSNPAQWDMLINPQTPHGPHDAVDQFGRDFMTHHAFPDLVSKIRINCDILPWPIIIDIKEDADRSPRIEDIFESIYVSLRKLASSVDFGNQTTERQHRIQKAYRSRCRQSSVPGERDGLRRIDFLEGQTMFLGLSPGNHVDEWHLHVGKEY